MGNIDKGITLTCLVLLFCTGHRLHARNYKPDIYCNNLESTIIALENDAEGSVIATVVRKKSVITSHKAILYIHGYCDYFYQKDLADSITKHNYNFYALDLRKYGRSLRPHQSPNHIQNIKTYFEEIDSTLNIIKNEGNTQVILMAHSTGGLISALYAEDHPKAFDKIIFNSPFWDFNLSWFMENVVLPIVSWLGQFFPDTIQENNSEGYYGKSLHQNNKGEWDYSLKLKPHSCFDIKWGWLRAIHQAQKELQSGLTITCPILVLHSDKSIHPNDEWNDSYQTSDIVLDVEEIKVYSKTLGKNVSIQEIKDGKHDLIRSNSPARNETYQAIFNFLKQEKPHS